MTRLPQNPKPLLRRQLRRPRQKRWKRPALKFTPTAWSKLLFLRDLGPTEVGGFGIAPRDQLLLVQDIRLVSQCCSEVTVAFEDAAVADFFDEQIDQGLQPEQFGRIWIHTHPGDSPYPSGTDRETFGRCFGGCDWGVMFILARGGGTYAELSWRQGGPGCRIPLRVEVDYALPFPASDVEAWEREYHEHVVDENIRWSLPAAQLAESSGEVFGSRFDQGHEDPDLMLF